MVANAASGEIFVFPLLVGGVVDYVDVRLIKGNPAMYIHQLVGYAGTTTLQWESTIEDAANPGQPDNTAWTPVIGGGPCEGNFTLENTVADTDTDFVANGRQTTIQAIWCKDRFLRPAVTAGVTANLVVNFVGLAASSPSH